MKEASFKFLRKLLETPSPSGFESKGQRIWLDYITSFADKVETDAYGNCFAILNPNGSPRVVLAGHADELGFMVNYISDEGYIYFKAIGDVDLSLVRGQRVVIHNPNGTVPGVTGLLAIHLQEEDDENKVPEIHQMFIDIGVTSRSEAEKQVQIGDPITYDVGVGRLAGNRIVARGCDNRIGVFAVAEGLRLAAEKRDKLSACVIAVSTIQEENGLYGATMAAYRLHPDAALVVDVTHATDIPACSKPKHGEVKMGQGPVLAIGSACHPVLNERIKQIAKKANIPLQYEINPKRTCTDADAMFIQKGGIPTVAIGLPNRYMHSPVELVDLGDLEKISQLLGAFVLDISKKEKFDITI